MIKRVHRHVARHLNKNKGLLKHIAVLSLASVVTIIFTILFKIYLGRKLGPGLFGELISLVAILFIILTGFSVLHTTLAKFFSHYNSKKQYGKMKYLFGRALRFLFFSGMWAFIAILSFSPFIYRFLKLTSIYPAIIFAFIVWISFLIPLRVGILRGLQRFFVLGVTDSIESILRLVFAIILVSLGMGVNGALIAIFLGMLFSFFSVLNLAGFLFKAKEQKIPHMHVYNYAIPVFLSLVSIAVMANIDIVLVKYFFEPVKAGLYAAASVLATVPFLASNSFSAVMFSKVSELCSSKKDTSSSLRHSLAYTFITAAAVIILLFLFSNPFIRLIFGEGYSIGNLPGLLSIAFSALSLSNVLVTYNLAIGKKRFMFLLPLFMLLEILMITLFHDSMMQIAFGLIALLVPLFLIILVLNRKEVFGKCQRENAPL